MIAHESKTLPILPSFGSIWPEKESSRNVQRSVPQNDAANTSYEIISDVKNNHNKLELPAI